MRHYTKIILENSIPIFFGSFIFGFIDNFLLVLAGESIDRTISATFGFSTMFSAGLGNTFSDVVGILTGGFTAVLISKFFKSKETNNQLINKRLLLTLQGLGICLGCLAGLFPLIFL